MRRVSVIVVSFNTREKLRRCLSCIEPHHETIVVDNASTDGSAEMVQTDFPHVHCVANDVNVGFGVANNLGCDVATGDAVLFLNSDAYAAPGAIDILGTALDDPEVVAAGGALQNPDGSRQESIAGRLTLTAVLLEQTGLERLAGRFGGIYWRTKIADAEWERTGRPVRVQQVMGACLLVRANHGQPPEPFDPRYFLYCEDTDLCLRLKRHGEIVFLPDAKFIHELGSSSAKDPSLGIIRYNWGKELYFRIHHGDRASAICRLMNRFGALLRLIIWSLLAPVKGTRQAKTFMRVLRAPGRPPTGWTRTSG